MLTGKRTLSDVVPSARSTLDECESSAKRRRVDDAASSESVMMIKSADGGGETSTISGGRTASGGDIVRNDQYLGKTNEHPRDPLIFMVESTHKYVYKGSSLHNTSVTTLGGKYFPAFESVKVSESIAAKGDDETKLDWKTRKEVPAKKPEYRTLDPQQIRNNWAVNALIQSTAGTALHNCLERFYYDLPLDAEIVKSHEFDMFKKFHKNIIKKRGMRMFHAEWIVYEMDKLRIGGSMDAPFMINRVGAHHPETKTALEAAGLCDAAATLVQSFMRTQIAVYDWKRTKEIYEKAFKKKGKYETGTGPCRDVLKCKTEKYRVQLCKYAYFLEMFYDCDCPELAIVCFHPSQKKFAFIPVDRLPGVVEEIMEIRAREVVELKRAHAIALERAVYTQRVATRVLITGDAAYANEDAVRKHLGVLGVDRGTPLEAAAGTAEDGSEASGVIPPLVFLTGGTNVGIDALIVRIASEMGIKYTVEVFDKGAEPIAMETKPEEYARLLKFFGPETKDYIQQVLEPYTAETTRNKRMVHEGKPDLVLVFHDAVYTCTNSTSTAAIARAATIPTLIIGNE